MWKRRAAVAGQFYPADPQELRDAVNAYVADSCVVAAPDRVLAIIAPHAGYVYSGPCAGYVYARVQGMKPKRVVILGRSHRSYFPGAAVYGGDAFETPLGAAPVDKPFAAELAAGEAGDQPAHASEHTLEVQVPFIQAVLGDVPIVPALFGSETASQHGAFAEHLSGLLEDGDLVVASTDLSHFLTEEEAMQIDRRTLDRVLSKDEEALAEELADGRCSMCGGTAVGVVMACAKALGADDWRLLDYRTSAQASGDYDRVVGYGAISMERPAE